MSAGNIDNSAGQDTPPLKRPPRKPETYPLLFPVQLKSADGSVMETITELQMGRLDGGAARRVLNMRDKGTGEFVAALVCASARIPPSTFDRLDAEDMAAAAEIAGDFLGSAPPTSRT